MVDKARSDSPFKIYSFSYMYAGIQCFLSVLKVTAVAASLTHKLEKRRLPNVRLAKYKLILCTELNPLAELLEEGFLFLEPSTSFD